MINILIIDDQPIIREGLKELLSHTSDITADTASNGRKGLEKIRTNNYDAIFLDIKMPGEDGIQTLKAIKAEMPELPVLMFSNYPEEQYAFRALQAGASGYFTKDYEPEILRKALRKAIAGEKYITESVAKMLVKYIGKDFQAPLYTQLSDREFQVMMKIVSGKSISEIADELYISDKTVSTYKHRILEKLNLKNDVELTVYAIRNKLIE
jgi:DNA-binding NarL/FixJ family response regulator